MLELFLCSLFTIVPDFLYRRHVQGKRLGKEITLFTVWFELRYGITGCVILTVLLIATIFYFHPSTTNVVAYFRTVPILPEGKGRVEEIYVKLRDRVKAGDRIFRLNSATQEAAMETARRRISEIDASFEQAKAELAASQGKVEEAKGAYNQAQDELETKSELNRRNPGTVAVREVERLQRLVESRQGSLTAASANKQSVETQIASLLPAQKASAEASLAQAQVDLDKTIIYAGFDGYIEQFTLRKGDIVNPMMRPAGILIPSEAGRKALIAGFAQIEAQVMKVGMTAEVTCIAKPLTIIPAVVTQVQGFIAAGQIRATETLVDPLQAAAPGSITVFLEPLYEGGFAALPPGSRCIANAYTSNHDRLDDPDIGFGEWLYLHFIDTVGLVHALLLRLQALLLPLQELVFSGGH